MLTQQILGKTPLDYNKTLKKLLRKHLISTKKSMSVKIKFVYKVTKKHANRISVTTDLCRTTFQTLSKEIHGNDSQGNVRKPTKVLYKIV